MKLQITPHHHDSANMTSLWLASLETHEICPLENSYLRSELRYIVLLGSVIEYTLGFINLKKVVQLEYRSHIKFVKLTAKD